jgi:hypothetical protein
MNIHTAIGATLQVNEDDIFKPASDKEIKQRDEVSVGNSEDLGLVKVDDLLEIVEIGQIDPAYNNINDWLCDFWSDLSWTKARRNRDIRSILNHPKFGVIQDFFLEKYDFDMARTLIQVLGQPVNEAEDIFKPASDSDISKRSSEALDLKIADELKQISSYDRATYNLRMLDNDEESFIANRVPRSAGYIDLSFDEFNKFNRSKLIKQFNAFDNHRIAYIYSGRYKNIDALLYVVDYRNIGNAVRNIYYHAYIWPKKANESEDIFKSASKSDIDDRTLIALSARMQQAQTLSKKGAVLQWAGADIKNFLQNAFPDFVDDVILSNDQFDVIPNKKLVKTFRTRCSSNPYKALSSVSMFYSARIMGKTALIYSVNVTGRPKSVIGAYVWPSRWDRTTTTVQGADDSA